MDTEKTGSNNGPGDVGNYDRPQTTEHKREGLNRCALLGRVLGPVAAITNGMLALALEVVEREPDDAGRWQDHDRHFGVLVLGKRAEGLARLDLEGSRVYVEGPLRLGKSAPYVEARKVILLGGRRVEPSSRPVEADIPF